MSIKNVLAFAGAAAAAGHNHYQHNHLHARGTGSAAPAIPTGLPACWGTCFQKAGVSSPDALCGDDEVSNCIKAACATADVASYEAWLEKQCNSGAPYPSGSNSTAVGPTATGGSGSISICTETSTLIYKSSTAYSTYLITHTLGYGSASSGVPVGAASGSASAPGGYGSGSPGAPSGTPDSPVGGDGECSDVTVTTTERTTVTVTAGEGSGPSSYAASSSEASAVSSSRAAPSSAAAPSSYGAPSSPAAPSSDAPVASSYVSQAGVPSSWGAPSSYDAPSSYAASSSAAASSEAAAPSSYAASSSAAPAPSSYAPGSSAAASSSSAAPSSSPSSAPSYDSGFRGKRGLAYNDSSMIIPALTDASKIGWAFNWEGTSKGFENSNIPYIPTLHSSDSYWTDMWTEQAEAAISSGSPFLFGPNEPDIPSQANMSPSDCADFWRQWMEPYAGRIKLVAPSVSSGVGSGIGLDWLEQFMGYCSDCTFDAVNQHWYNSEGNDVENFKDTINGAAKYGPVFVGEFGAIGSASDISSFMDEVMPWMDSNSDILGYAYFMVYQGLLVDGTALSPYGISSHPVTTSTNLMLTCHRRDLLQRLLEERCNGQRGERGIFASYLLVYRLFIWIVLPFNVSITDNRETMSRARTCACPQP